MLTIISKFNNFRNRQGEYYTTEDLTKLSKAVITSDVIHFKGNMSYGFNSTVANCIYKYIDNKYKKGKILIINDLSLHMADKLIDEGFDINNIYIAYGKWTKNADLDKDLYVYETMKKHIEVSFKEKLNVIKLEDIFNMQFDLIIANPPYGKIGAQITKKIIDDVDYKEFINLLPANDYKRVPELWQYQSDMEPCKDAFEDAAVTTHVAKIHKNKVNNMSLSDYEISNYVDPQLDKYFKENSKRSHYAIDKAQLQMSFSKNPDEILLRAPLCTTFMLHCREVNHKHLSGKSSESYKWNTNTVDEKLFVESHRAGTQTHITFGGPVFRTSIEKINLVHFCYSNTGCKFLSKLWTSLNIDSSVLFSIWLPKVDWTRSWTVEEILKEYNYTDEEIKEVMEDLKNFKGMND